MKLVMACVLSGAILLMNEARAAEALPEPLKACISLKRDLERLACYDRAVASMQVGSEAPAASPENMFGVTSAMVAQPPEPEKKREELQQISGQVVSVGRAENGLLEVALDNDQVWRQQDSETTLIIETGDSVTISRASLGTFRITDKRGRSARFRRVR